MDSLLQDLRYGIRAMIKRPALNAVAVIALALGIGANTAIFSVINALLLQPLPGVEDPAKLAVIYTSDYSSSRYATSSFPDYIDFRDQADLFSGMAAFSDSVAINLGVGDGAERIQGAIVTGNYFSVLGVKPQLGRTLLPEDDRPESPPAALLSHELWQNRFASDRNIIGKTVSLNSQSFTVVGVAPEDFKGVRLELAPALWMPMAMMAQIQRSPATILTRRGSRWVSIVGRLSPEATVEQAQAQIQTIAAQLAAAYPDTNLGTLQQPDQPRPMSVVPASIAMVNPNTREETANFVRLLMLVVGVVLVIACANVANLLLARARGRQKEIAVRLALGASRLRIIRQMLTESVFLSLVGGAAGLLVAVWLTELLSSFDQLSSFAALEIKVDNRVLVFTLVVSILTGILFGLAPALQASRPDLVPALKDTPGGESSRQRRFGLRSLLVIFQVVLSMILLIGAGLFLRSLQKAYTTDLGFTVDNALLATVDLSAQGYNEAQGREFYKQLLERVETLPGVESASMAAYIPVNAGGSRDNVTVEGYEPRAGEDMELNINTVERGYFETMGIQIQAGRAFTEQDRSSPLKVVINEAMAEHYWPGQDAVGRRIRFGDSKNPYLEIIGVARTGKYRSFREQPLPYIYLPYDHQYRTRMTLLIRAPGDPSAVLPAVRAEVQRLNKNVPLYNVKTLTEHLGVTLARERMIATLVGLFGLLALALAAVGIYGLMAYSVTERIREIGIRMALGAQKRDILLLVLGHSLLLSGIGLGIGLVFTLVFTQLISSLLYETSPTDSVSFVTAALTLTGVMLLASYIPARRATKVDPMIALRYE
jgi:macrolide transport system ATP-binding/permease protein